MSTELVEHIGPLRERLDRARNSNHRIGFVPTMGALHAGHGKLIDQTRLECPYGVVSIFVNPLQFGPHEDFELYPRSLKKDLEFSEAHQADLVFAPGVRDMHPKEQGMYVDIGPEGRHLCGPFRPGHFRGVATVVLKLLNIVQPDVAYFGEKDIQQLAVIQRMVRDFNMSVRIAAVPTVRESDGLALSSRNQYLSPEERSAAPVLYRALGVGRQCIAAGERNPAAVLAAARAGLGAEPRARLEYLEVVDTEMQPVAEIGGPVRIAGAIWIGRTRLIDNVLASPPGRHSR